MSYGFIRNTDTWGVDSIPFDQYQQAGITNLLFNASDPNLARALDNARAHHVQAGIWADPHSMTPSAFAQYLNTLASKYHPDLEVPDVEFTGKGNPGSQGWNWSQQFVDNFRKLNPQQHLGLTVMPNQSDFNYGAYLKGGADVFLPQSYGATYDTKFDPNGVVDTLVKSGVPRDKIQAVLAPGQHGSGSYYALDDFTPAQIRALVNQPRTNAPAPRASAPAARPAPDMGAIQAAIREGVMNPSRYMMQAKTNPGVRKTVNTVLRRQVASKPPVRR